jgi:Protein of unknown function (DUF3300)
MKRLFTLFSVSLLLFSCLALSPMGLAQSIKPGTEIHVQLLDQLDTGNAQVGQQFAATLAEPIVLDSGLVWPKGTQVKGEIVDVVSSGRLSRPASITLRLTQIGNAPFQTENETIDGKSHAGRNAALIGGLGAFGALLGGIADGGKGAVIGAAAGAGAGVATAAATGKQEIVLRTETPLTFAVANNVATEPQVSSPAPEPGEAAQPETAQPQYQPQDSGYQPYAPEQLDNLLAPIALYPDPLLAQVLLAATFPDEIQEAARWVPVNDPYNIDYQSWDVSVKAVAHYPTVLAMLNGQLDWTTALGQAYIYQPADVMTSVQRLRNLAYSQGNLLSTLEQQVIFDGGHIQIVPAQPRLIYVPAYDPGVIYARPVYRPGFGFDGFFSFGTGYAIGAWLNHDMDWNSHRVIYDGWDARPGGWRERSRPYVQVTNVYVDNRYEQVNVNRNVLVRQVNYENVNRNNSVHRDVNFDNRARIESDRARNEQWRANQRQPSNDGVNERGNGNGNQFGVRKQPSYDVQPTQPQAPSNVGSERPNEPPSNAEPRPEVPNERVNERGNGVGNQFGVRNQPSSDRQPTQPKAPSNVSFERPNSTPSNAASSRPQAPNVPVDERGNGVGNQFGVRSQSPITPAQPARTSPQTPRPQAVSGAPTAAHPIENQPRAHAQQKETQPREGAGNKGKENSGDKK